MHGLIVVAMCMLDIIKTIVLAQVCYFLLEIVMLVSIRLVLSLFTTELSYDS